MEKSIGFYRRFGFEDSDAWPDPQGALRPSGQLQFSPDEIKRCRALLKEQGIVIPEDADQVPFRKAPVSH